MPTLFDEVDRLRAQVDRQRKEISEWRERATTAERALERLRKKPASFDPTYADSPVSESAWARESNGSGV